MKINSPVQLKLWVILLSAVQAFYFQNVQAQTREEKKTDVVRIKIKQVKDGKTIEIDTTFNRPANFNMDEFLRSKGIDPLPAEEVIIGKNERTGGTNCIKKQIIEEEREIVINNSDTTVRRDIRQNIECTVENKNGRTMKSVSRVIITDAEKADADLLTPPSNEAKNPRILKLENLDMYPSPGDGKFCLKFTSIDHRPLSLRITDLSGREVYREEVTEFKGEYKKEIDISGGAKGIYLLQILQGDAILVKRLVIQ